MTLIDGRGESHSVQLGFKALRVTFRHTCGLLFYVDEAAKNNVQFKRTTRSALPISHPKYVNSSRKCDGTPASISSCTSPKLEQLPHSHCGIISGVFSLDRIFFELHLLVFNHFFNLVTATTCDHMRAINSLSDRTSN